MPIELSEQQHRALESESDQPPRVVDPQTNNIYVLVPLADYETVREILEDERQQRALHEMGLRNALGRMYDEP